MNPKKIVLTVLVLAIVLSVNPVNAMGVNVNAEQISKKIQTTGFVKVVIIKNENLAGNSNIRHIQADLYNSQNPLPVRMDVVWNTRKDQVKNIYLHPGSGLSFEADFLAKPDPVIALANNRSRVIGISPREAQATLDMDMTMLKDRDLVNHTKDFEKIINLVQSINNQPYEVGGHSAGALVAAHYASLAGNTKRKFKALRNIDMAAQYPPGSVERTNAIITSQAIRQLMSEGVYANFENVGFKQIAEMARLNPSGDSGVPRGNPLPGNFTNIGLLYLSLIFTGGLPGMYTDLTGLPGSWYLKQGYLAGTYNFALNPAEDTFSLTYTNINTVYAALDSVGSGVYPLSYEKNMVDVWSDANPIINWANIKVPVYWINTEGGFGNTNPASLMLNSPQVTFSVMPVYGHADPTFADNVATDFWTKLFPGIL
jgi:pimeloyl-ACP methyl ester carboxylesterase